MKSDCDLLSRALRNYFARGHRDQPANDSGPIEHRSQQYVALRNIRGTLAMFAVSRTGRLRWLDAWPRVLDRY